jgi:hypothetical protein
MALPLWKIKRELTRPFLQLKRLPPRLTSLLFSKTYYDRVLAPRKQVTEGTASTSGKVAIYLIFPQTGVLASHLEALRYLAANGYAPVVVSNLPLNDADRSTIHEHACLLIERPNYGYDFGGYRDGVLEIAQRFADVERLVLLNDSAWFPLPGSANWLQEAEQLDLDYVGAATNYGHARVNPEEFRNLSWSYSSEHRNFHYCSFALMISGKLFSDPSFQRFWRNFPLTNNKTVTVRRGEIGMSQWVIRNQFTHASTLDIADLDQHLSALPDDELRHIAEQTVIPEMPQMQDILVKTLAGTPTREELIGLILTSIARQGISYTQPRLVHRDFGFAFLKKSPIWLDETASDLTLAFARDLDGPFGQVIWDEALDLRRTRAKAFAPVAD